MLTTDLEPAPRMMIAFLISLVTAYLLPATPAATTCRHWLDAATARDRVGWVEINCESLPCPCSAAAGGGDESPDPPDAREGCVTPEGVRRLVFSASEFPNIRAHFRAAVANGWPRRLVLNRPGADERRDRLLRDIPTRDGFDRDEYPPAVARGKGKGLTRGRGPRGWKADVRHVPSSENRSHGATLGAKLRGLCDGARFRDVFR